MDPERSVLFVDLIEPLDERSPLVVALREVVKEGLPSFPDRPLGDLESCAFESARRFVYPVQQRLQ